MQNNTASYCCDAGILGDGSLFVAEFRHKAVIQVNESGVEAAAISAMTMLRSRRGAPQPIPDVVFNRSFFATVYDNQEKTPLFLARIEDP